MKRVELKRGRTIETPWLRIEEAAAYCGMHRATFQERAASLPHSGDRDLKLYHCEMLDRFIAGELPDSPFSLGKSAKKMPRRRRRMGVVACEGLIDPVTGKHYPMFKPAPGPEQQAGEGR